MDVSPHAKVIQIKICRKMRTYLNTLCREMDYFNLRAVAPTRAFFEHSPESGKVLRNAALTLPFSILDKDIIFN